jgi:hypothetical protein
MIKNSNSCKYGSNMLQICIICVSNATNPSSNYEHNYYKYATKLHCYKVSNATNASVCLNNCKYATNASNRSNWFKMFQTCVECASNATNPLNK